MAITIKRAVFDGSTLALKSGNGSHTLTRASTGRFTVTWDAPFSSGNYAVSVGGSDDAAQPTYSYQAGTNASPTRDASSCTFLTLGNAGVRNAADIMVIAVGDA